MDMKFKEYDAEILKEREKLQKEKKIDSVIPQKSSLKNIKKLLTPGNVFELYRFLGEKGQLVRRRLVAANQRKAFWSILLSDLLPPA